MRLVILCIFVMSMSPLFAEETIKNSEIQFGAIFFTGPVADSVYANLYKMPLLGGLDLGYTYRTHTAEHNISLRGGAGRIFSPYGTTYSDTPPVSDLAFQLNIQYASVFQVWNTSTSSFMLGPGIHLSANAWIPDSPSINILRYTWLLHSGIGVRLRFHWNIDTLHALTAQIYTPMLNIGWRPTYSVYTLREETLLETQGFATVLFDSPVFLSLHNFVSMDIRFAYRYSVTSLLALKVEYYGVLEYITIPRSRLELQNNVVFDLVFSF